MKKNKTTLVNAKGQQIRRSILLSLIGVAVVLAAKAGFDYWYAPHRIMQRGLAKGETVFALAKLVGDDWRKVCVVPIGGYIWDVDFKDPDNEPAEFFRQQFGGSTPSDFASGDSFVWLYIEDEKGKGGWKFIGERRHPYIKDSEQRAKPPYWDTLLSRGILIACTTNKNAALVAKKDLFFTRKFESQYRFVYDGKTGEQSLEINN